jgi:hypothetical protein
MHADLLWLKSLAATVMATVASPLLLFGFLALKYLSYREPLSRLRWRLVRRWVLPVVAGVSLFAAGIYMQFVYVERYWPTEPYLAWWHCWLLLLGLDVILLVAWIKAAIRDRISKVSRVVDGVRTVAREVLGDHTVRPADASDAATPSEGEAGGDQ